MALDFAAGFAGGCAGLVVGYPLDTIKVHIQTQKDVKCRGTWHCFQTILAKQSVSGFYQGISSPLAGVAVINAIVFGVYGHTQRLFSDVDDLSRHFLCGAVAGLAQSPVASPLELIKTRLQLQSGENHLGPLQCLRQIYKTGGLRGVFSGLWVTTLREVPSYGIYFYTYEALTKVNSVTPISTFHMLMAGGLAGSASWIFTYPIDVLKSRIQADSSGKYSGVIDCYRQSILEEGYICLFRGLNSTILRAFPTNAATFTVVHWILRAFDQQNIQPDKTTTKCDSVQCS